MESKQKENEQGNVKQPEDKSRLMESRPEQQSSNLEPADPTNQASQSEHQNEEGRLTAVKYSQEPSPHAKIIQRNMTELIERIEIENTPLLEALWEKKVLTIEEMKQIRVGFFIS